MIIEKEEVEMKVVVAIDSFKGSLSSIEAGNIIKEASLYLIAGILFKMEITNV
ncbi:MAG: glycerate kinase [Clostridium sp.]